MRKVGTLILLTSTFLLNSFSVAPTNLENNITHENLSETRMITQTQIEENIYNEEHVEFVSTIAEDFLGRSVEDLEPEPTPTPVSPQEQSPEYVEIRVVVSFYSGLEEENGTGNGGKNAIGGKLSNTSVAIPRKDKLVTYGTKLEFESFSDGYMKDYNGKYLTRIADDCGSPKHIRVREDGIYRMDIYCPRLKGETNSQYWQRVNSYGKYETTCKVYLKK